ncbi:hypothetical protein Tco_1134576 [Tanacetum coccineum]
MNSEHETDENESGSESDQEENEEDEDDDEEVKDGLLKTPSKDSGDEDETKITDKEEGDEDKEMDYTTRQLYDDVDIRLNEPVDTDKGFVQEEGSDAAMTNVENLEILQVIKDAHLTLLTIPWKTEVLVTSSSHLSDLAAKFLNFSDIPHIDAEIVSPVDVHVHHEVPSKQTSSLLTVPVLFITTNPQYALPNFASVFQFNNRITTLEKEVAELKKDPLHTQVTTLDDDHLDARLVATRDEFMYHLSSSINARVTKQVKIQLPQILPKEVSNFAPLVIQSMVTKSLEHTVLAKESSQPQSSYDVAATLTEFELKKILIDRMDKSKSYLEAPEQRECYEGLKKSYDLDKTIFSTYGNVY